MQVLDPIALLIIEASTQEDPFEEEPKWGEAIPTLPLSRSRVECPWRRNTAESREPQSGKALKISLRPTRRVSRPSVDPWAPILPYGSTSRLGILPAERALGRLARSPLSGGLAVEAAPSLTKRTENGTYM